MSCVSCRKCYFMVICQVYRSQQNLPIDIKNVHMIRLVINLLHLMKSMLQLKIYTNSLKKSDTYTTKQKRTSPTAISSVRSSKQMLYIQIEFQDLEADIIDALNRYNKLIADLEAYPEWSDKVIQEVGKWFHLIHNNLA